MAIARIDEKHAALLAISIAVLGMIGLYFFGQQATYEIAAPAMVGIMEDGTPVEVAGKIQSVEEKESTVSIRICDDGSCVSVSAPKALARDFLVFEGMEVSVFGEVSSYKGAKFVRAQKIGYAGR